ncbi:NACHT, LRR and PYD domains-containing protein 1 homolog isoform X2 [Triplophysa dalaica]|uniref:NACHT, LRR and PYD domains-containing protein 1 homolog isoform X2 n=1 Tax=Triplophysa dalaica TaxID=1582913 RepID=UPI0024E02879|nr:NACHT, LRR and PYD domains-containing protein 1 homolog isoform X2 [Triplophysa dalaica]
MADSDEDPDTEEMSRSSKRSNKTFIEKKLGSALRFFRRNRGPDTEDMSWSFTPSNKTFTDKKVGTSLRLSRWKTAFQQQPPPVWFADNSDEEPGSVTLPSSSNEPNTPEWAVSEAEPGPRCFMPETLTVKDIAGPDTDDMSCLSRRSNKTFTDKKVGWAEHSRWKTGPDTDDMSCLSKRSNKTFYGFVEHGLTKRYSRQKTEWTEAVDRYKMSIKQKYIQDEDQLLAKLYTEPVIIQQMINGGFKNVHVDELFEPNSPFHESIVILQGNSGSGKSYTAQKILLDWASGERYHDFDLVFYLRCEELVCVNEEMSLFELLSWSCSLTSDQISVILEYSSNKVLFLVDGFDEFRFQCNDFYRFHPSAKVLPEVLVSALLRGHILPRSTLMITTRTKVPQETLLKTSQRFTKITGFSEKKIEEYFQKFFQDEDLFWKAYNSVKANETLFTAFSSPLICWIVCTVIRERFNDGSDVTSGLETTTSKYFDFVSTLLENQGHGLSESVLTLLKSLGQLAERGLMEQQVLFDERTINETVQDPVHNPFLNKFLLEKRIQQETMYRFMHLSFQEFFTALYYVLLDEDESQKKVRELLHAVERGWALSCWSDANFTVADITIRRSKHLQSVILFLWGFCKNKSINSFFEKHNVTVPVNIETQLKEWIHQCSQRYQHENMLFILHCLHELHDKSFTGKVLEGLILIDLSNISLNWTDCSVLRFCLQCCQHIKNLRLKITSENLKILQPALCSCEELCFMTDHLSVHFGDLISSLGEGRILKQLIIRVSKKWRKNYLEQLIIAASKDGDLWLCVSGSKCTSQSPLLLSEVTFCCSYSEISTFGWKIILQRLKTFPSNMSKGTLLEVIQSVPGLKKVHLQVDSLNDKLKSTILSIIRTSPCLNELRINATISFIPLMLTQSLKKSLRSNGWTLTVRRSSILIERDRTSLIEGKVKTVTVNKDGSLNSVSGVSMEAELYSTGQPSLDAEVFTPEYVDRDDETIRMNKHRFLSPYAGSFRCSLTNLVFVMEGKGEMLYKIVSWDPRLLDGVVQMQPAGPLYNIDCFEGSISQLYLPHCEILSETKDSLAVARFTDGNVEILQPLKVTETHVIVDITKLSMFGLLKIIFPDSPVSAQVLLFLRPITVAKKQKILNVHLLPWNVPLPEVQSRHQEKSYIETSSICHLIPGRNYRLCCHPEKCEVQPPDEVFECNFGPNFYPTYQVFLDVSIEEVRLGLLDTTYKEKEVWKQRRVPLSVFLTTTGQEVEPTADKRLTGSAFLHKHGPQLIQKVKSVMEIADCLRSRDMITSEKYDKVHTAEPPQEKMRILLTVLESETVKEEFYRLLEEKIPLVVDELKSLELM